jgi:hypothetical protein
MRQRSHGGTDRRWYWLLLIPYIAMLWVPSYNFMKPSLAGVPFFYWYQFVWIAVTALIIWVVYLLAHSGGRE